ncbi:Peptidase family M48 [Chitinophaga terrae (ex Kim and Jung 2007)]|uniref:Peptidase family M48 n=1 Tax=Chitinophaga terrae (ex Kim and Jung 2007) TaxID=408074 RepID=A0A1H4ASL0_9BACT|nr:M48 family metallopeptidase [Chitinophaga terrae (ex Kim and Jung 2007)]GEP89162.1 hypothetical protein CTE07_08070 [Chitinophaga terrae (ex Kim and Jung 2007)]SEA38870.1 Peptidase family M48 [Chitinophaga terrae (ex Kim and Jung 2007)]
MYPGKYYNDQTSALTQVNITLFDTYLEFKPVENIKATRHSWNFDEIQFLEINKNFVKLIHSTDGGLEIRDPEFIQTFKKLYSHTRGTSIYSMVLRGGTKAAFLTAGILFAILVICYFFVIPWGAEKIAGQLPKSVDREVGQAARAALDETIDTAGSKLLTEFASGINWKSDDTLRFSVVKSEVVNAYALPGGYIVVYSELLKKIQTKEELAALLAHEVSHVNHRHSIRKLCKDLSTSILVNTILGNIGAVSASLYSNATTIYNLRYSREYEKEADIEGLELLRTNHIDQKGMLDLMKILSGIDKKIAVPTFLSTHPLTGNRINYLEQQIKEHPSSYTDMPALNGPFRALKKLYH